MPPECLLLQVADYGGKELQCEQLRAPCTGNQLSLARWGSLIILLCSLPICNFSTQHKKNSTYMWKNSALRRVSNMYLLQTISLRIHQKLEVAISHSKGHWPQMCEVACINIFFKDLMMWGLSFLKGRQWSVSNVDFHGLYFGRFSVAVILYLHS